ncbi:MAG: hypothetical protein JWO42_4016, partial [Chloroflexi bacterium]|nr:hypothetical protein [Chloroflexota bacterium]
VQKAFSDGAKRVWLHTDNFDGTHALPNYSARGFSVVRETTHQDTILER